MSGDGSDSENRLLMGHYNPAERRKAVMERLDIELKKIEATDYTSDVPEAPEPKQEEVNSPKEEEVTLESFFPEMKTLIDEVALLQDVHITKHYRTLQGTCSKLQQRIDNVKTQGNTELRERKGIALSLINRISQVLSSKVHENEKCCQDCELYGSKWDRLRN